MENTFASVKGSLELKALYLRTCCAQAIGVAISAFVSFWCLYTLKHFLFYCYVSMYGASNFYFIHILNDTTDFVLGVNLIAFFYFMYELGVTRIKLARFYKKNLHIAPKKYQKKFRFSYTLKHYFFNLALLVGMFFAAVYFESFDNNGPYAFFYKDIVTFLLSTAVMKILWIVVFDYTIHSEIIDVKPLFKKEGDDYE